MGFKAIMGIQKHLLSYLFRTITFFVTGMNGRFGCFIKITVKISHMQHQTLTTRGEGGGMDMQENTYGVCKNDVEK